MSVVISISRSGFVSYGSRHANAAAVCCLSFGSWCLSPAASCLSPAACHLKGAVVLFVYSGSRYEDGGVPA